MSDPIDHVVLGLSRLSDQYESQPDLAAYLTALLAPLNNLETAARDVEESLDIDVATGVQLDRIGVIVGIGRGVPNADPLPFFGFLDTPNGQVYGDLDFPDRGERFFEVGEVRSTTLELDDPTYRRFLRARILRNRAAGTVEDFIAILQLIFPGDDIIVKEGQLQIIVGLDRPTTITEDVFLSDGSLMPKPAGVALITLPYTALVTYFGFDPTGAVYGDLDFPARGGPIAEEQY